MAGNLKYKDFVKENVVDDIEDIYNIIDVAAERISSDFDISGDKTNNDFEDMLITIFCKTYQTIVKQIHRHILERKDVTEDTGFEIEFAKRLVIGYDNALNEEYEKNGGFMIYLKHLYHESSNDNNREYEDTSIELCTMWNSANITKDTEFIKKCASDTVKALNDLDIAIESQELIMPIFAYIYDALIQYVTIKRAETKEFKYTINFCSMFDVSALEGSEDSINDVISLQPAIWSKLELKSDALASSKYDE